MDNNKAFLKFLCMIIIILSLSAVAEAKVLHDKWYYDRDTFTVDGEVYAVTHFDFNSDKVLFEAAGHSYVIKEGQCESSMYRTYCIDDIYRDINKTEANKTPAVKFEGSKAYAHIHIIISSRVPEISVSRTFTKKEPLLGEQVNVTITIKNSGTDMANDIMYDESFPYGVQVLSSTSNTHTDSSVSFKKSSMLPGTQVVYEYSFKLLNYTEFDSIGLASYEMKDTVVRMNTSSVIIKTAKPSEKYLFSVQASPLSIELGEDTAFSIKIEDKSGQPINITKLEIIIPDDVVIGSVVNRQFNSVFGSYYWNGTIDASDSMMTNWLLRSGKPGNYTIKVNLRLIMNSTNKSISDSKNVTLKVSPKPAEPILSVKESFLSDDSLRIAFSVKNPNKKSAFYNVTALIKSSFMSDLVGEIGEIKAGETKTMMIAEDLKAPFVINKTKYSINATGSYIVGQDTVLFSKGITITVNPLNQSIFIIQSANTKTLAPGMNVTVTVKIKSTIKDGLKVEVGDAISAGAEIKAGKNSNTLFFEKDEEKQAYVYNILLPETYDKPELIIVTIASVPEKGFITNTTLTIPVNLTKPGSEGEEQESEKTSSSEPKVPSEKSEKTGFFTKVINSITGFFKRLFGKE